MWASCYNVLMDFDIDGLMNVWMDFMVNHELCCHPFYSGTFNISSF